VIEWTKIKPKHFLYNDFTLTERGALATILCLTAYLERIPSHQEMVKATHYKSLITLQQRLNSHSIALQDVLLKVLEDVSGVEHKRAVSRGTSKRYREKDKPSDGDSDMSCDTTEKRREEERREDSTTQVKDLLNQFPSNLHQNINLYIERARQKNKSKVITPGRHITLLTELYNSMERCKDNTLFTYALEMAINYDVSNIGYVNAIIKNKKTVKPR